MEKENVLELEITALNDEYSLVKVTKINDEVIKEGEAYFYIDVYNNIEESVDNCLTSDKLHYDMGNYFKTEEEAKRISTELCNFWKKVRNNRIREEGKQKE